MTMTTQEMELNLRSLATEIVGQEAAIASWEEALAKSEERLDVDESRRLHQEIDGARRTVRVAKEQQKAMSEGAKTAQQKGQTR